MRLIDLEPQWLKIVDLRTRRRVEGIAPQEADGILFKCPVCFQANGGSIGTHSIICWQPHVSQDHPPTPGRWSFEGSSFNDLTLVAGSSSILLTRGCKAHFFIRNGGIEVC
ncbi:MAG TPA: hypothetical protein VGF77_08555 [Allosphingosinicella sp.]|jgi:hypothetical protein